MTEYSWVPPGLSLARYSKSVEVQQIHDDSVLQLVIVEVCTVR